MTTSDLGWAIALLLAEAWAVELLGRALDRGRRRRRAQRALRAERDAERLLERCGYAIEQRQAPLSWSILCDGAPHEVALRADLIVSRAGRRYVAEVKSGDAAPRLASANTRRQLLEYAVAYDVHGVLLVDMETERVQSVDFGLEPDDDARAGGVALVAGLIGAALGAAALAWIG